MISLLFDRMMDERRQPGWGECGGGAVEQQNKYTRGQRRKSHDDFQLNGGNVTEINLHKYNMVRACCCHFICPLYRRMLCMRMCTYVCMYVCGASTHKHVCTEVRIDLCAEIEFSASFFLFIFQI